MGCNRRIVSELTLYKQWNTIANLFSTYLLLFHKKKMTQFRINILEPAAYIITSFTPYYNAWTMSKNDSVMFDQKCIFHWTSMVVCVYLIKLSKEVVRNTILQYFTITKYFKDCHFRSRHTRQSAHGQSLDCDFHSYFIQHFTMATWFTILSEIHLKLPQL